MREFMTFLRHYGIIGLAIAVIIGGKANAMVTALVDGILMPIIGAFIPSGNWREATIMIGKVKLVPGPLLGAMVDFLIVALIVFWFSKKVLREEAVAKK